LLRFFEDKNSRTATHEYSKISLRALAIVGAATGLWPTSTRLPLVVLLAEVAF
jgi:hypothetical protein